jgi:iron complex outermembrane recepter protein
MAVTLSKKRLPLAAAIAATLGAGFIAQAGNAQEGAAATPASEASSTLEEILVTGSLRSLPGEDVEIFGFGKSLLETPRSASTISSEQLERFNITDIDELVVFAPGTFTQSFFGVAGSLDVRGTPGETYFRGMRRLDNPGNYPTPIGASDRIDIVRGPASPIYGPSKIGGYLNFNPKSARAESGDYLEEQKGGVSYTAGSWDKNVLSGEVGGPLSDSMGYYLYGEVENSDGYYNNTATDQVILQASFDWDVSDNLRFQFGGMYHEYEGSQVAGWNRLTQDLVDNGTYITGTAQSLDSDGDGYISHQEYRDTADFNPDDGDGSFGINPFVFRPELVTEADLDSLMALENPGTTKLDGDQVVVAKEDLMENDVLTLYFDAHYYFDSGLSVKNQLFYEAYDNVNQNAYGFSQFHDTWVVEDKLVFAYNIEGDGVTTALQVSPSVRYTDFKHGDDYTNEYFDRRDLTMESSALDRRLLSTVIDDEYTEYYEGDYLNFGFAVLADVSFDSGFSAMVGARYDVIDVESSIPVDKLLLENFSSGFVLQSDDGKYLLNDFVDTANYTADDITAPVKASDTDEGLSWTVSLSYDSPIGLIPYVTWSEQTTLIAGQGAEITTGNIYNDAAMDTSTLTEFGVKGSYLEDSLYFALSFYEQERTDYNAQAIVTNSTDRTEGIEAELRWVVNDNLVLTAGYTNVEVVNLNTLKNGGRFSFYGAEDLPQIDPTLLFGGAINGIPSATSESDARKAGIPENIYTLSGTYTFNNGVAVNASVVDVDSTYSGYSQAVKLPSYTLLNASINYEWNDWRFSLTGKNLTDERYFRANFPNLFGSQIVLQELPRHYQAKVAYRF